MATQDDFKINFFMTAYIIVQFYYKQLNVSMRFLFAKRINNFLETSKSNSIDMVIMENCRKMMHQKWFCPKRPKRDRKLDFQARNTSRIHVI